MKIVYKVIVLIFVLLQLNCSDSKKSNQQKASTITIPQYLASEYFLLHYAGKIGTEKASMLLANWANGNVIGDLKVKKTTIRFHGEINLDESLTLYLENGDIVFTNIENSHHFSGEFHSKENPSSIFQMQVVSMHYDANLLGYWHNNNSKCQCIVGQKNEDQIDIIFRCENDRSMPNPVKTFEKLGDSFTGQFESCQSQLSLEQNKLNLELVQQKLICELAFLEGEYIRE